MRVRGLARRSASSSTSRGASPRSFRTSLTIVYEREVEVVSEALLTRARFPDHVPLLVHRFVRERLLDRGARRGPGAPVRGGPLSRR
jgi:hypothetical protein